MMLGQMELSGSMYRDNEPTLVSDGRDLAEALEKAVSNLPQDIYRAQKRAVAPPSLDQSFPAPSHVKPNAFVMVHDEVAVRIGDSLKTLPGLPAETKVRVRRLIRVRDAVRECLRSQLDGSDEATIVAAREKLNQTYDSFVSRFGPISSHANTRAFDGDPDLPLLLSLEVYDEETKRAKKTAIFRERTIQYQKPIESVELPKEALIVSLNEKGRVDLDHMSALLGRSEDEFLPELRGAIFLNPQSNDWETDDQYLSGNVRDKLEIAMAACITDQRFRENVEALKAVQPEDLTATEIDVRLGASWVPAEDVERFCNELVSATGIEVSHSSRHRHLGRQWRLLRQTHRCQHHRMGNGPRRRARPDSRRAESPHADHLRQRTQVGQIRCRIRKQPKVRVRNSRRSRTGSRNGFGSTTSAASGWSGNTTTNSTMSGCGRSAAII